MKSKRSQYVKELNWDIVEAPVTTTIGNVEITIPNKKALINNQTQEVLSIRAKSYKTVTNERFVEIANKLQETYDLELDYYGVHNGGRKMVAAFKNPKTQTILGHEFDSNICIIDSRDGTTKLGISSVGTLHRCQNVFQAARKSIQFSIGHTGRMHDLIDEWLIQMELFQIEQDARIERIEKLVDKPINKENVYDMIGGWVDLDWSEVAELAMGVHLEDVSTKKRNIVQGITSSVRTEAKSLGGLNGFSLWNGVTHYFSNKKKKGELETLFGQAGTRENQAIAYIESL